MNPKILYTILNLTTYSAVSISLMAMDPQLGDLNGSNDVTSRSADQEKSDISLTQRDLKLILSKNVNYIHEPYWNYNEIQLEGYAKRILERIKPLIVNQNDIKCERSGCLINHNGKNIKLRKIPDDYHSFGRVLPTLYLNGELKNNKDLGVPLMFLVPKNSNAPITFTFNFVHKRTKFYDVSNNPLQVSCDDFEIYKEDIPGTGEVGDRAFARYGHMDFNERQTITSLLDGKLYLIDTKEEKNFFLPIFFSDYTDIIISPKFSDLYSGPKKDFSHWESKLQQYMIQEKMKNFHQDIKSLNISVPCGLHCHPTDIPAAPETYQMFDFSTTNPRFQFQTAIKTGNLDALKTILSQNKEIVLGEEKIPNFESLSLELPIQVAMSANDGQHRMDMVTYLLAQGQKLDDSVPSAIEKIESSQERLSMVRYLLTKGAKLDGSLSSALNTKHLDFGLMNFLFDKGEKATDNDIYDAIKHTLVLNKVNFIQEFMSKQSDDRISNENLTKIIETILKNDLSKEINIHILEIILKHTSQKVIIDYIEYFIKTNNMQLDKKLKLIPLFLKYITDVKISSKLLFNIIDIGGLELAHKVSKNVLPIVSLLSAAAFENKPEWVDLVLKLKVLTSYEIDAGLISALANRRMEILEKLLLLKPDRTPKTDTYIDENIQDYWGEMILESAIKFKEDLVFDLLIKRLKEDKYSYLRLAVVYNNMYALERMLDDDFLTRIGLLKGLDTDWGQYKPLNSLLNYVLRTAFDYDRNDIIDFVYNKFKDYLRVDYLTVSSAVGEGHGMDTFGRFLNTNEDKVNALSRAAYYGNVSLAKDLLMQLQETPEEAEALDRAQSETIHNFKNADGATTIQNRIWKRMREIPNPKLEATLMASIESDKSDLSLLKQIVDKFEPNLNFVGANWVTPLMMAIYTNDIDMVKFLLDHGADPDLPGKPIVSSGYPLTVAILQFIKHVPSSVRGIRLFEKQYPGAEISGKVGMKNVEKHNLEMVQLLLKYGADAHRKIDDPENWTYSKLTPEEYSKAGNPEGYKLKKHEFNGWKYGEPNYRKAEKITFTDLALRHDFHNIAEALQVDERLQQQIKVHKQAKVNQRARLQQQDELLKQEEMRNQAKLEQQNGLK